MLRSEPPGPPARRVGYVLKMYPRFSETFILNEVRALEDLGAELEIFSLRPPVDGRFHAALAEVRAPVHYVAHPAKVGDLWDTLQRGRDVLASLDDQLPELLAAGPADAAQAVELALAVRAQGISHLHAHFGSVSTTVTRLAAKLTGVPYSFTAHAKDIYHCEVDPSDLARKLADAAAVVTVSDYNADFLRAEYGPAAERLVRIYNGLDLDEFAYHRPVDRPAVIAGVGRLVEKKGFAYLLDALAMLVADDRPVRLDLVGTGAEEESLRAQAATLGVTDHVRFLGPLPQAQTREIVRNAAVLAAPCVVGADGNRDGLPTVLVESMALGTPVVATPVTGIPEAVVDGETGIVVPERDAAALAAALGLLLDRPAVGATLAAAARAHVEREFDIRRNVGALYRLFARRPVEVTG
ncbi:MAG: glycosyltransferase [Nocardioidaceae bacterium]